jgi:hypothetical protein
VANPFDFEDGAEVDHVSLRGRDAEQHAVAVEAVIAGDLVKKG